ncbi:MAG: YjjG family noncanonical pyrimidine nucleotidase [Bacteroidales bacterium]
MKYSDIFFDLDRTLWDFESNAIETFKDLYKKHKLEEKGITDFLDFVKVYKEHNEFLWAQYREGNIKKEVLRSKRFSLTLKDYKIYDEILANEMGDDYIDISPTKTKLFPNCIEILDYLSDKYNLHIITNGFEEVQYNKLINCGLFKYFDKIITSEKIGVKKPNPQIFIHATEEANTSIEESIMIGDDFDIDIEGAQSVNMDQVYFNPFSDLETRKATYEISDLIELKKYL